MPSDPFTIFAAAPDWKKGSLKATWQELYDCLAGVEVDKPAITCPLHGLDDKIYRPVVARLTLNGTPACVNCVTAKSRRPGGYPMKRIDPREWRE